MSLDEVQLLREAAQDADDALMVTYIDIGRFTGMRLSEIGELSTGSIVIEGGVKCFRVSPDAKTEASSNRLIPIAPALASCVELETLDLRGTSNAVGKRFGRLKRLVLEDGSTRQKCFHSIRKFVVTTLEQGGVAEGIAADLVGHEKPNITYNVYSGGSKATLWRCYSSVSGKFLVDLLSMRQILPPLSSLITMIVVVECLARMKNLIGVIALNAVLMSSKKGSRSMTQPVSGLEPFKKMGRLYKAPYP